MSRLSRALVALVALGMFAFLSGFVIFASLIERDQPKAVPHAEGIVVLTGGEQRVAEGLRLMADGKGKRLLISGANERTSTQALRRLTGARSDLLKCCVDIGHEAKDTHGNAVEARDWNRKWRFSSLIIVTSAYHMPRSLTEFSALLPQVRLIPYPVISQNVQLDKWWLHAPTAHVIFIEYVKFLPTAVRHWPARWVDQLRSRWSGNAFAPSAETRHAA